MSDDNIPIKWKKFQILATAIAALLIPLVIAIVGHSVNSSIKQNELSLQYVQLAIGVLNQKPTTETKNLRLWAIDVVNNYSSVKLSRETVGELQSTVLRSVAAYKLARSPACGIEKMVSGGEAGRPIYHECRHPSHGVESYSESDTKPNK
jgi:hypothetical protein